MSAGGWVPLLVSCLLQEGRAQQNARPASCHCTYEKLRLGEVGSLLKATLLMDNS